jgi:chromosome partition protein MukB
MSRTRATALALVNWKGVFFERYLLDPHVTALEGANGAGKTTVMIAAYLVLLPDLTRLRFTNLGETAATGGDRGIFGRLGAPGRPSYAALELELAGERVILGVHLERKAEPSVQATPFMVHGLARTHGLSALFLVTDGESEGVPELAELKIRASALSARFEGFDTLRDYFGALFERGIVPLRLANDDDRAKYNEMLRTSMTGGISRALTTDLRTFVLREESGLSDTLSRMRANLDACRRTRAEVLEARALEREISGVYEAGRAMFAAALGALAAELHEATRRRDVAQSEEREAEWSLARAEAALADGVAREEAARGRAREAREQLDTARVAREARKRAAELAARRYDLEAELAPAATESQVARIELERRQSVRDASKVELGRARDAYDRAARGLANLQSGLEELHRRAHAFRRGHAVFEEARTLTGEPKLLDSELETALERARKEIVTLDAERARRERELKTEQSRRDDFARARAALCDLVTPAEETALYSLARRELARLGELVPRAREVAPLAAELERTRRAEKRREDAGSRLAGASIEFEVGNAARAVEERVLLRAGELSREEELARDHATARRGAEEEAARLGQRAAEARAAAERFRRCRAVATRLEPHCGGPPTSLDEVTAAKERLVGERETLRARAFALRARREALLAEASRYEHGGGALPANVLELCEELGGEPVAARFEDIDVERAARVQAGLGALASAIVVEDVRAGLERLAQSGTRFDEVLLVRAGESVHAEDGELVHARLLAVPTEHGLRVSRLPERPTLGKNAREARRLGLLEEAEHVALELERATTDVRYVESALADSDELGRDAALAFGPDPQTALAELEARQRAELERAETLAAESVAAVARAGAIQRELELLRPLVAEAHFLDAIPGAAVDELEQALAAARSAEAELERTEAARRVLGEWLEALRVPPPSTEELARFESERALLDAERDRWFRAEEALASAIATRQARGYTGAEAALDESTRLVPALEAELEELARTVTQADAELGQNDASSDEQAARFRELDARRAAVAAHVERVATELAALAPDFSPRALAESEAEVERATERSLAVDSETASVVELIGSLRERKRQAETALAERSAALAKEDAAIAPLEERRRELLDDIDAAGLLAPADAPAVTAGATGSSERELLAEARSRREVLIDRLLRARGGQALAEELARRFGSDAELLASYVAVWKEVTTWLARRLPSQVADVPDPLRALERLRDHLALLEERLGRQELELRGASEDVARGIEVKLRRATGQVRRLNQHLEGISFGSIARIRVEMRRVERMDQILRALREGQAQELLFQTSLPVEEALDEIFRRYGGGKSGGQRLLDYREYLELEVAVERKAKPGFEAVSPTRLSTGEAIGVGAALMMVVLTEWERDANLFRNRRTEGTLRFLFLDEANRLSQDNLGVLFDLCRTLELQLLIAAPEVARATGNTTYRLVRQVAPDGSEEVIVTGRRATLAAGSDEPAPIDEPALGDEPALADPDALPFFADVSTSN